MTRHGWVRGLGEDVRHACRALRRARGFAAWIVGSLAIGIAVTIAALAFLNAILLLPFPEVAEQERLVRVAVSRNCGRPDCWTRMSSPADYAALQDGLTSVEAVAAYALGQLAVGIPDARSVRGALVSANYFDVLRVRPAVGRLFDHADAATNAAVTVVSHSMWTRELGGDGTAIGRTIVVGDRFVTIVGVAPPLFTGINRVNAGARAPELWVPLWLGEDALPLTQAEQRRGARDLAFVARLKDGADAAQVQAEAAVVARRLAVSGNSPSSHGMAEVRRVWRVDPKSWHLGIIVIMPIPLLVLAIACVNAANLLLARGSQRRREIAIRLAIGAARARVVRQLLVESAVLTLVATAVALPVAWWGLRFASVPFDIPIPFDPFVLTLTVLTAAATTFAFGLVPAFRVSAQPPSSTLGSGASRGDALPVQSRGRRLLVVAQMAVSLGLLATAWQLVSTVRAQAVSAGTPGDRLLIARFDLQPLTVAAHEGERTYDELLAATLRLAGIEAAGLARHTSVWTFGHRSASGSLTVWHSTDAPEEGRSTIGGYAGGRLFDAVGLRLLAGRDFTEADRVSPPRVAMVNRTFADAMKEPAVGGTIRVAPAGQDFRASVDVRIVGIIDSVVEPRLEAEGPPAPRLYLPSPIEPEPSLALYIRTHVPAVAVATPFRELVGRIAPRVPIVELATLAEMNERSYSVQLWLARAAAFLGVVGLLLATAGLYGVASYVVSMRSREIAIRLAIGARPQAILSMILGQSLRVAVLGLVFGGAAAAAISRWIQSEYHGVHGLDAPAFAGAALLFVTAMLVAGGVPALRASRLDPLENLREG